MSGGGKRSLCVQIVFPIAVIPRFILILRHSRFESGDKGKRCASPKQFCPLRWLPAIRATLIKINHPRLCGEYRKQNPVPVAQGFVISPTARAASAARMACGQCRPFAEPSDCFSALHDKRILLKRAFFMSQK